MADSLCVQPVYSHSFADFNPANKLGDFGTWLASITHIEWFNTIGESVTMVTGFIFIMCVLAFRRGIIGELAARLR